MAKERPVPSGRKPSNARGQQAEAGCPARPRPTPATPSPRRPATDGPADPRPIAAPFIQPPPELPEAEATFPAALPSDIHPPEAQLSCGRPPNTEPPNTEPPNSEPPNSEPPNSELPNSESPEARAGRERRNAASAETWRPGTANGSPTAPQPGRFGSRRNSGPAGARRDDAVPAPRPRFPGLHLQPLVHVGVMAASVDFYERLGGALIHGDRDDEWVLMQVGTAQIGLVTRPPDAYRGESTVELNFAATMPLDLLEQLLREHGVTVVDVARDGNLGTQLHVETPDGMPIKIHQVEPDLLV